jgi:hypothetical protein
VLVTGDGIREYERSGCDRLRGRGESVIRVANISGLRSNSNPDGGRSETRSKVRDGDDIWRLCLGVKCVSVK